MQLISKTGAAGQDGAGSGIYGGDVNPQLPHGADGTAGEAVLLEQIDVVLTDYLQLDAHGGRGGYAGFGFDQPSSTSPDYVPGGDGGHSGSGGLGGDASAVVDNATTNNTIRASAWGGRGGHGGEGGDGAISPYGTYAGGDGGNGGNGSAGGNAIARVLNSNLSSVNGGYIEIVAQAGAGTGGSGGAAGYGGAGDGPGAPGTAGLGGAGGNAVAEIIGNHVDVTVGNVSLGAYATAGHGGWGGNGASGGNWVGNHPGYQPAETPGRAGGAAGTAVATISGNIITAGDFANVVQLSAMIGQAIGGTGGFGGSGAVRAEQGANGTGVMSIVGNNVSLGGGDDRLIISLIVFEGSTVQFAENIFDGGAGFDTLEVSANFINQGGQAVSAITLDLSKGFSGFDNVLGSAGVDHLIAAAGGSAIDGGNGNDWLEGREGVDSLRGGSDNDRLGGGGGDDLLAGGTGDDFIDGGTGSDTASYASAYAGVIVSLARNGLSQDTLGDGIDTLVAIENLIGSAYADQLTGNAASNVLSAGAGDDIINGALGDDRLEGGDGNDTLLGSAGADTLIGGSGSDQLNGGTGADILAGGAGDDTYIVDNVGDVANEATGEGIDTIRSLGVELWLDNLSEIENVTLVSGNTNIHGNDLDNRLNGSNGTNVLEGGLGNDILRGNGGADTLLGGAGLDSLYGGSGRDTLTGGAGVDRFFFTALSESSPGSVNADRITDFSQAEHDRIVLAGIDAIAGGTDDTFTFIGTAAFSGTAGELRYRFDANHDTVVMMDVDGDGVVDMSIVLTGEINLTAGDFVL